MTRGDIFNICKILLLALVSWTLPPRLWRAVAVATSIAGRDDQSGDAYRDNLGASPSQAAAISRRRRAYTRELNLQIVGLTGPWRAWRPHTRLIGAEYLRTALDTGHGAILWMTETSFGTLVAKMILADAGIRAVQLSRPQHGFSTTEFGMRYLNPIWTAVEDRFIAERVAINGQYATDALTVLRARLATNHVIIVAVAPQAHRLALMPFLQSRLPIPTGPIRLARETGAALLPAFTLANDSGGFELSIHAPLSPGVAEIDDESIALAYVRQLESFALNHPDQWTGWHWLTPQAPV